MKVLVANKPGELKFIEVEKPVPGPHEVLAKVKHCGICATDISIADGTLNLGPGNDPIYPVRIGHEWSAVIEAAGSETRRLKVGDGIIGDSGYFCGECRPCLEGEYECCENGRAVGTTGNCWPGGFAEYVLMPERICMKVPENVPLDVAAAVEPAAIGLCGLLRANISPGKNLLVIGTGPIGLGGMACAKGMGVGKIILAGRKDKKLEIGKEMGAAVLVNTTRESLRDVVMRETNGRGMDIVMDTTGSAGLFNEILELVRPGGYIVIPGFYEQPIPNANIDRIIARNCTLVGAAGKNKTGVKILDMMSNGLVDLSPMITEHYSFENAVEGFEAVKKHNDSRVKIMVDFD